MEESKELKSLYRLMQCAVYASLIIEMGIFLLQPSLLLQLGDTHLWQLKILAGLQKTPMYANLYNSKLFTLLLLSLVCVGSLSKKDKDLNPVRQIAVPFILGLFLLVSSVLAYGKPSSFIWQHLSLSDIVYISCSLMGTISLHIALDNMSKLIGTNLGKDRWNVEQESFMQPTEPIDEPYAVNIPMLFYHKGKVREGWLPIANVLRGTIVLGVPGSGKSYGIILPIIRDLIRDKGFCLCIYDFKFPDLAKVAYYHYLLAKQKGRCLNYDFHVINLTEVEKSRRINPLRKDYIVTLANANETAEALVEALKKGDKSSGSDQFFTQSAINFLAACIYFFSRIDGGKYSTLPHVLAFLNRGYDEIFNTLFSEPELISLLSPFSSAYKSQAFQQLEGQVGTLKIFISRLATKETFWVFSDDDFDLKISDPENPSILILANDPNTQNINSTCYSVVLNRLTRLLNSKGNLPSGIIVDEAPTLFIFRAENLIATARSNKVALVLGLQELPQLEQQYGKETAQTITSIVGNVLSGSVRSKETLEWLEKLFGQVKQLGESITIDRAKTTMTINEKLEHLIPAGKIAALKSGEMVGILASDTVDKFTGKFEPTMVNCRINLDYNSIKREEENYRELPVYYDFKGKKDAVLTENFNRITQDIQTLVDRYKPKVKPSTVVKGGFDKPVTSSSEKKKV